jgi:hypothetical protein
MAMSAGVARVQRRSDGDASPGGRSPHLTAVDYYRRDEIRARMLEACGGGPAKRPSAAYIAGLGESPDPWMTWEHAERRASDRIETLWARGMDISRSLWDAAQLIFMLDLDYLNVDEPAEPFLRPAEVFFKLEPTYRAALRVFRTLNLPLRSIVTGRGYQFAGCLRLDAPVVDRLAALAATPSWFAGMDQRHPEGLPFSMSARQARASAGLGLLMEYIAHRILADASAHSQIPVVFNGTVAGTGRVGRECVSIDFSHVGDPLDVRLMRVAFSTYQWHRFRPDVFGPVAAGLPPLAAIPRARSSLLRLLTDGRTLETGVCVARDADVRLRSIADGIDDVLTVYQRSPLAAFHRDFYAERQRPACLDSAALPADLPPCVSVPLAQPNDLLLKPGQLQHLVRVLMARGQGAAAIAGIVQSAYEADHGWGDRWSRMDPRTRAEFDVRVFAGMIATGADTLVDFNCVSAQEKGLCPGAQCTFDLRRDRDRLQRAFR